MGYPSDEDFAAARRGPDYARYGLLINRMARDAAENSAAHGFHDKMPMTEDFIPNRIALIHEEVSEALSAHRERGLETWHREDGKPEGFAYELADIMIRVGDLAHGMGIDLDQAIRQKMDFNKGRPHLHGKSY